jgi:multiple sugar transport system permease protein
MTTINPSASIGTGAYDDVSARDSTRARARIQRRKKLGSVGVTIGVAAIVVYCLAPFYWMVVSSLRRTSDLFSSNPVPSPLSLDGYRAAFKPLNGFPQAILNSVLVAGVATAAGLFFAIVCAYAIARLDFRYKNIVVAVIITTSMFPGVTLIVPLFQLFTNIGWINTYQAMIVPDLSGALPLAVFNLVAFFRQMPFELEEAARVDGCTPLQSFRRVILPIAAPGVFTTAIIVFIAVWNEFLIANSMVNEKARMVVTVIIAQFTGSTANEIPYGAKMAAGVIVTLPLVALVLLFQRRIVSGLTAGGVK